MTTQLLSPPSVSRNPADGTKHISYSQVRTYCMCSLKWYLSRFYTEMSVPSALVFGKAWHSAVELFYQSHMQGITSTHAQMLERFTSEYDKETKPITYTSKEDRDVLQDKADKMLEVFLQHVKPGKVIAIEEEVRCDISNGCKPLLGYIDLVEIVENEQGAEELVLVDFKTAARKPTEADVNQLTLYAIAAHRTGISSQYNLPISLRYDYITKTSNPEYIQFRYTPDRTTAHRLLSLIRCCNRGMDEGIIYPNPGWQCSGCGYKHLCGKWPELPTVQRDSRPKLPEAIAV